MFAKQHYNGVVWAVNFPSLVSFYIETNDYPFTFSSWFSLPPLPGTSLLQEVVYLVSQGADPDEIGLMNIDEQLPVLEYPQPGLDIIQVGLQYWVLLLPDPESLACKTDRYS